MKGNKSFKLICLILLFCVNQSYGQLSQEFAFWNNGPELLQAPNVSSLGTYGRIPVSPFTGVADISIPLYELKIPQFPIPIELKYHPYNAKPNSIPGIAGLGWSLVCGGNITRKKNLNIDEHRTYGFLNTYDRLSDNWAKYYNYPSGTTSNWYDEWLLKQVGWELSGFDSRFTDQDTPDEFHFNFLNYTGSFYLDHKGKWILKSDTDFKIEHKVVTTESSRPGTVTLRSQNSLEFILTAPDGIRFYFGGKEAVDYTYPYQIKNYNYTEDFYSKDMATYASMITTTWHLSKIELPTKRTIEFIYKPADPVLEVDMNIYAISNYINASDFLRYNFQSIFPVLLSSIRYNGTDIANLEYKNTTQLDYPRKYLSNWKVEANYNFVDEFDISDNKYVDFGGIVPVKSFNEFKRSALSKLAINLPIEPILYEFKYEENIDERLKLKEVNKIIGSSEETYYLEYNKNKLPGFLSGFYDHLGFYNGEDFSFVLDYTFSRQKEMR